MNHYTTVTLQGMYLWLIIYLVSVVRAQPNRCACSCCLGQFCQPSVVGTVNVQNCSVEICATQCRCAYPQCAANSPYGQMSVQCSSPALTMFSCECMCCNVGSPTCTPGFVGTATAYSCQTSSCSIACAAQYPIQCVSNANGYTQGLCTGPLVATTTSTPMPPWLGNICSCSYCQSGYTCASNTILGITSASQCSSSACTQACQSRYQAGCSSVYQSQISGACLSQPGGRFICKCNCCSGFSCIDYEISMNETCGSCYAKCVQVSPCANVGTITQTCGLNRSIISTNLSLFIISIILIIVFIISH